MARINIETTVWTDPRFQDLMIAIGNRHAAKGLLLEFWVLAQQFWFPQKRGIPREAVERAGLGAVITCGLAELRGEEVYAKGAESAFAWLFQKQEAGKKGGLAKAKRPLAGASARKHTPSVRCQNLASSSSSFSSSSSESKSESKKTPSGGLPSAPTVKSPVGLFVATFVQAYQARYGPAARPNLVGKVQGQIKRFVTETPIDRACELIQVYCQMDDKWFTTKCHDFGTFLENLSKVGLALDTGEAAPESAPVDFVAMIKEKEPEREIRRV